MHTAELHTAAKSPRETRRVLRADTKPASAQGANIARMNIQVTIASSRFDGLPLLDQHRLVNEALAEPLRDGTIHELRIKTKGMA